ncbi:MAG: ferredoxin [Actinomycetota bacterium]|nr:ferredoxin [Actinomycetota bacterium]
MPLEVHVDRARCIGSRTCVNAAPSVFELDGAGIAVVADPRGDPEDAVLAAAEACPTGAIVVRRDGDANG